MRLLPVLLRWVPATFVATIAAVSVATLTSFDRRLTVQVYVLFVGALVFLTVAAVIALATAERPSPFEDALSRRGRRPTRPEELERLERQVALAAESAFDFYFRLRPSLVDAAAAALWRRHGVPLEQGEHHFAPEVWELVRPDLGPPDDRLATGPPLDRLNAAVAAIEGISR